MSEVAGAGKVEQQIPERIYIEDSSVIAAIVKMDISRWKRQLCKNILSESGNFEL